MALHGDVLFHAPCVAHRFEREYPGKRPRNPEADLTDEDDNDEVATDERFDRRPRQQQPPRRGRSGEFEGEWERREQGDISRRYRTSDRGYLDEEDDASMI